MKKRNRSLDAFTLIELLVVIAVMAILAGLVFPITKAARVARIKAKCRGQMAHIETAIADYKIKMGHYPPDNPGLPATNQLYYELVGTTVNAGVFTTLDGSTNVKASDVPLAFTSGVGGFVNVTRGGGDEGGAATAYAKFRPDEWTDVHINGSGLVVRVLTGVSWQSGDPPFDKPPLPLEATANPWRYNSSHPTNNPSSYDLWIDVNAGSKVYRICNWSPNPVPIAAP